jgi:tetraacyldisaccharide 4'-kinase
MLAAGGAQLILCDDGLQHLRLARDCAIAVIDGARGFGNGRLLPAGPLREPATALAGADLIVLNGAPEHLSLAQLPLAGALRMDLIAGDARRVDGAEASRALSAFRDRPVHAVAGIGHPARFFRELRAQGLEVIEHAFPDHHAFAGADLAFGDALPVLMTEKDAVKCAAFADARLWYVPVTARFSEQDARQLMARVLAKTGDLSVAGS